MTQLAQRTGDAPASKDRVGSDTGTVALVTEHPLRYQPPVGGLGHLPRDLSENELAALPTLVSAEVLLIKDLGADEYEAFLAALAS